MKRQLLTIGAGVIALGIATACDPIPAPPPPPPPALPPARCGLTINDQVVVATVGDAGRCPAGPNGRRVVTDEYCGPLMEGNNAVDDCYRGNFVAKTGRVQVGAVIARWSSFGPGDTRQAWVASDYWASTR